MPFYMDQRLKWGCLFCYTGTEEYVAEQITHFDWVERAITARQVKHFSRNGVRGNREVVLLPGYVFFLVSLDANVQVLLRTDGVLRVLSYGDTWALHGDDLRFVEWLAARDGLIGVSRAYRIGDRICIVEGPLKELEGVITKVDKHNRNGQVSLNIVGKEFKVWLAFEYITLESE